jgi:hypothetical protein
MARGSSSGIAPNRRTGAIMNKRITIESLDLLAGKGRETGMFIVRAVTSDGPDGQPGPPPDSNTLWAVVRRAGGCTLWRAIQFALVQTAATDFCNSYRQQPQLEK